MEPTIVDSKDAKALEGSIDTVKFENVYFTYPGTSTPVLNGISFNVNGGEFLELWVIQEQEKQPFSNY